jgi:hypothetical protein
VPPLGHTSQPIKLLVGPPTQSRSDESADDTGGKLTTRQEISTLKLPLAVRFQPRRASGTMLRDRPCRCGESSRRRTVPRSSRTAIR